jgi:hypothetical protein
LLHCIRNDGHFHNDGAVHGKLTFEVVITEKAAATMMPPCGMLHALAHRENCVVKILEPTLIAAQAPRSTYLYKNNMPRQRPSSPGRAAQQRETPPEKYVLRRHMKPNRRRRKTQKSL